MGIDNHAFDKKHVPIIHDGIVSSLHVQETPVAVRQSIYDGLPGSAPGRVWHCNTLHDICASYFIH